MKILTEYGMASNSAIAEYVSYERFEQSLESSQIARKAAENVALSPTDQLKDGKLPPREISEQLLDPLLVRKILDKSENLTQSNKQKIRSALDALLLHAEAVLETIKCKAFELAEDPCTRQLLISFATEPRFREFTSSDFRIRMLLALAPYLEESNVLPVFAQEIFDSKEHRESARAALKLLNFSSPIKEQSVIDGIIELKIGRSRTPATIELLRELNPKIQGQASSAMVDRAIKFFKLTHRGDIDLDLECLKGALRLCHSKVAEDALKDASKRDVADKKFYELTQVVGSAAFVVTSYGTFFGLCCASSPLFRYFQSDVAQSGFLFFLFACSVGFAALATCWVCENLFKKRAKDSRVTTASPEMIE